MGEKRPFPALHTGNYAMTLIIISQPFVLMVNCFSKGAVSLEDIFVETSMNQFLREYLPVMNSWFSIKDLSLRVVPTKHLFEVKLIRTLHLHITS